VAGALKDPRNLLQGPTASRYWCAMIREDLMQVGQVVRGPGRELTR